MRRKEIRKFNNDICPICDGKTLKKEGLGMGLKGICTRCGEMFR